MFPWCIKLLNIIPVSQNVIRKLFQIYTEVILVQNGPLAQNDCSPKKMTMKDTRRAPCQGKDEVTVMSPQAEKCQLWLQRIRI